MSKRSVRRSIAGAVLIEWLISLPLLLTVIAAIVDYGMSFREQAAIYEALRSTGRAAARQQTKSADPADGQIDPFKDEIRQYITNWLVENKINASDFSIEIEPFQMLTSSGESLPYLRFSVHRTVARSLFWKSGDIKFCATSVVKARLSKYSALPLDTGLTAPCGGPEWKGKNLSAAPR